MSTNLVIIGSNFNSEVFISLDGEQLHAVRSIIFSMEVNSIPTATIEYIVTVEEFGRNFYNIESLKAMKSFSVTSTGAGEIVVTIEVEVRNTTMLPTAVGNEATLISSTPDSFLAKLRGLLNLKRI